MDGTNLTNKEGLWKSNDPWIFKFDGKFVNIVNTKENEVLGIGKSDNSTGGVISGGTMAKTELLCLKNVGHR